MAQDSETSQITLTLPDGTSRSVASGTTGAEVAASIGAGLARAAIAAKVDGEVIDLSREINSDAEFEIVTPATDDGRYVLRHSTAHVMAQAVTELFPGARYAIGPPISDGFYYDFELPGGAHFTEEDLARVEAAMVKIIKADQSFEREETNFEAGLAIFADQPYKREIIEGVTSGSGDDVAASEVGETVVSVYRNLNADGTVAFTDLCRGPHLPSTKRIAAFKLTKVAGAYWRGDEHRAMLQRIYGTAWESKAALEEHLHKIAEAERRDHRRLGTDLDLFSTPEELGGGLVVWHPKGAAVRAVMEDFSRAEHERCGYDLVYTPHVAKSVLWETSGHLDFYSEGMYPPMEMDGATYYPKPMNCPFHVLIYRSRLRPYRDLPLRLFELGTVYRYERSGVLHGLMRVRGFTQDDSHIFCTPDQLAGELESLLEFVVAMVSAFGFENFEAEVATRPAEKSVGEDSDWELATNALISAIEASGLKYRVAQGEGAFYGPKIDIHLTDAIGRRWQLSTLQVDFQLPARFDIEYVGADNQRHRPIMIHRALFGSVERFFGILVEHYAGAFPTWLAPVQCVILPVADRHENYAAQVRDELRKDRIRAELVDAQGDSLGARIRRSKLEKVPYILVVGDDDVEAQTVGVNVRGQDDPIRGVPLSEFAAQLRNEIATRALVCGVINK